MTKMMTFARKSKGSLLWLIAVLYLLFSPSIIYHVLPGEGKPVEMWKAQPQKTSGIRYRIEDCKFFSGNKVSYAEKETYALWGWAFLNTGLNTRQADFDRFAIIYNDTNAYVFPMQVYQRPDVQEAWEKLGLPDLSSSGFYSVIAMNALAVDKYSIGLLFEDRQDGTRHYVPTNKVLVRSPNHLSLESKQE